MNQTRKKCCHWTDQGEKKKCCHWTDLGKLEEYLSVFFFCPDNLLYLIPVDSHLPVPHGSTKIIVLSNQRFFFKIKNKFIIGSALN